MRTRACRDMLFQEEPPISWTARRSAKRAVDREQYEFWSRKDPITSYAAAADGVDAPAPRDVQARRRGDGGNGSAGGCQPWPEPAQASVGVFANEPPRVRLSPLSLPRAEGRIEPALPALDPGLPRQEGDTFLERDGRCWRRARTDPRVFVYGETSVDNGARVLLRPLLKEFGDRIINSPIAENAIFGIAVGAPSRASAPSRKSSSTISSRPVSINW